MDEINIGDNCIFGESVKIYDHNHAFKRLDFSIAKQGYATAPISIGENCWIGSNVIILKGSNIGAKCVIGAGCIIYSIVPPNSIVRCTNNYNIACRRE